MVKPSVAEVELLKNLYIQLDTPVDGFIAKRDELVRLANEFNDQVSGSFTPDQLLGFMMNQRMRGLWPRIRREFHGRRVKQAS